MNIVIFDTETTSLDKPFCYNIGYNIVNVETEKSLLQKEYVAEQVWYNKPLFESAYYKEKRPLYVADMRARKIELKKFGCICRQMIRDFKTYNVERAFAYNSGFDERVFNFNCDWFKCSNPFDNVPISDIRGYTHEFLVDDNYKKFCEKNNYLTETANYSTTAEIVYRYITKDNDFIESHTALSDSLIETDILFETLKNGAKINGDYKAKKSVKKDIVKTLQIEKDKKIVFSTDYKSMRISKDKTLIKIK